MGSFQVRVGIRCPLETVFAVYTDPDPWHWCSFFRNARWVYGKPWEAESRIRLEADDGSSGTVEHVITRVERNSRVDFITHFAGITLHTQVTFVALSGLETGINARLDFVGVYLRIAGFAVGPVLERRTRDFFEDLSRECERRFQRRQSRAANKNALS